jgi:hypothetical protein
MDSPISVGDGIDAKQAVLAAFRGQIWHPAEQPITLDPAINHNVRDVNAERAVLARHALRDHPQPCFRGGEVRKSWLASHARGSAREDDRAAAERRQAPRRLPANQKPTKAADPPELLKLLSAL